MVNKKNKNERNLYVYYLKGCDVSGISILSRKLGERLSNGHSIHIAPTPINGIHSHFAQDYQNEVVSIIDKFEPNNFNIAGFKLIFDNHTYTPILEKNRIIKWSPKYAILVNPLDYDKCFAKLVKQESPMYVDDSGKVKQTFNAQDLLSQTKRRIACVVELDVGGQCTILVRTQYESNLKTKTGKNAIFYDFKKIAEFNFGVLNVNNNAEKLTSAIFDELLKHGLC